MTLAGAIWIALVASIVLLVLCIGRLPRLCSVASEQHLPRWPSGQGPGHRCRWRTSARWADGEALSVSYSSRLSKGSELIAAAEVTLGGDSATLW